MRTIFGALGVALLTTAGSAWAQGEPAGVTGFYAEARSLAIYAGACHYNGEVTTAGAEAILAWKVREGAFDGVSLNGLSAVAVVAGTGNLSDAAQSRRAVLYVDAKATKAQRDAFSAMVTKNAGKTVGAITVVKSASISFDRSGESTKVAVGKDVRLEGLAYPCEHCKMESQVWYSPLTPGVSAMVGQGLNTGYVEKSLGVSWQHEPVDNVYLGTFRW